MNNLLKVGIKQNVIDDMIENNSTSSVIALDNSYDNVFKIFNTLKILKVKDSIIDNLLINRIDLFFMDYEKFLEKVKKYNQNEIAYLLDADITNVEDIFFD